MAVLATSGITLPKNIADGMFKKAQQGSAIAALSGAEPQQFGEVTYMTLTGRPKAELVAEGADKADTNATFGTKTATPHKFQVTMRFNEEVQWADEAYQLGVLQALADEGGLALARALDLGGFHGINPRTGAVAASIVAGDRIGTTTNSVEITTATLTTPDLVIEQAAGLVIADGYVPNGIAFDPTYSWTVATSRYSEVPGARLRNLGDLFRGSAGILVVHGFGRSRDRVGDGCEGDRRSVGRVPLGCPEEHPRRADPLR